MFPLRNPFFCQFLDHFSFNNELKRPNSHNVRPGLKDVGPRAELPARRA